MMQRDTERQSDHAHLNAWWLVDLLGSPPIFNYIATPNSGEQRQTAINI